MANSISGTNVAAPVVPFTDADQYATAYANHIQGGRHSVATLADRNNIPVKRRIKGMTCFVEADDTTYRLINNPTTLTTQDSDWKEDIPSSENIVLNDGTTLEAKVTSMETDIAERFIQFCLEPVAVGINDKEQLMPFKAKIISLTANVPMDTTLTKDLVLNIEMYNGTWSVVGTVTILSSDPSKSGTKILTVPQDISAGNRVRVNVTSVQDTGVQSLMVNVGLQLTK
jgi:hypothetical protein